MLKSNRKILLRQGLEKWGDKCYNTRKNAEARGVYRHFCAVFKHNVSYVIIQTKIRDAKYSSVFLCRKTWLVHVIIKAKMRKFEASIFVPYSNITSVKLYYKKNTEA